MQVNVKHKSTLHWAQFYSQYCELPESMWIITLYYLQLPVPGKVKNFIHILHVLHILSFKIQSHINIRNLTCLSFLIHNATSVFS